MSANGKDLLTFNRSDVGFGWNQDLTEIAAYFAKLAALGMSKPKDDATVEDLEIIKYERLVAQAQMAEMQAKQMELIAQVLVNVPRSWLVKNAPDEINWGDPQSQRYIKSDKYKDVIDSLSPESSAKN